MLVKDLNLVVSGDTASSSCSIPDSISGMGSCTITMSSTSFSHGADVEAPVVVTAMSTSSDKILAQTGVFRITLRRVPSYVSLQGVGMVMSLPVHPVYPGDSLTANIVASSMANVLTAWHVTITYNSCVLTYVSTSTNSTFDSSVMLSKSGSVDLISSGLGPGVSEVVATGSNIGIAGIHFIVNEGARTGVHLGVISLHVNSMANVHSLIIGSDIWAQVNDGRDGNWTSAELIVLGRQYVGIMSYSNQSEIVNTAPLNGHPIIASVTVYVIDSQATSAASVVTGSLQCVSSDPTILQTNFETCGITVTRHSLAGSSMVTVHVSYLGLSSTVVFRVWYPIRLDISSSDSHLGLISLGRKSSCSIYQISSLIGTAVFSGHELPSISVHVTKLLTFHSENISVATISGSTVMGHQKGITRISAILSSVVLGEISIRIYVGHSVAIV